MKKILFTILTITTVVTSSAQEITGDWYGYLKEFQLRIVFHITETEDGLASTMDSPDQGANGIPTTKTLFEDSTLNITAANLGATFSGQLVDDAIKGTFSQGGMNIPLILTREAMDKPMVNRPQEPTAPYPYHIEEVTFANNKVGITLAGTLTIPEKDGNFPVVVLISGSGPQDRNEELAGHKTFFGLGGPSHQKWYCRTSVR